MLHDEGTILVVAPTLKKYYVEKSFRLVCDPFACLGPGTRYALLADNTVRSLIDKMLPLATLVTQSKPKAKLGLSQEKKVSILSLADLVSVSAVETSIPIWPKIESTSTMSMAAR